MKKNYILSLALLLFATLMGQSVKAEEQDQPVVPTIEDLDLQKDAEGCYLLEEDDDWYTLADYVAAGGETRNCTFKMTADIGLETPINRPIGKQVGTSKINDRMRFRGTFNGNGMTLHVNISNDPEEYPEGYYKKETDGVDGQFRYYDRYCAPFAFVDGATIHDLTVMGTIKTKTQFAAGLIGQSGQDNDTNSTCFIHDCHVKVEFWGNTPGTSVNGNHGTFVSIVEGYCEITNSWFDGKIMGLNYYYSGGFIGQNKGTAVLTDCFFNPEEIAETVDKGGSSEFSRNLGGSSTLSNCYYTMSFSEPADAQGKKVVASYDDPQDTYIPVTTADGGTWFIIQHYYKWTHFVEEVADPTIEVVTLQNDITAGTLDQGVVIDRDVTINLNGFTIDRALDVVDATGIAERETEAQSQNPPTTILPGYVLKVNSGKIVTIKNGSTTKNGTIRGGHTGLNIDNISYGGGIINEGALTLEGVTVTSNYADNGGGIYNAGTLNLNDYVDGSTAVGTVITGNHKKILGTNETGTYYGAGVYNAENATLNINGKNVKISGNDLSKKNKTENNLYLAGSSVINLTTLPTGSGAIGVAKDVADADVVFTSGLNDRAITCFKSNVDNVIIGKNASGEAYLYKKQAIELKNHTTEEDPTNASILEPLVDRKVDVTLKGRTFIKDGTWNTICLPFNIKREGVFKNTQVRTLTSSSIDESGKLILTFGDTNVTEMVAGKPYIVKWETTGENVTDPKFTNVIIKTSTPTTVETTACNFIGTFDSKLLGNDASILYVGTNNKLYHPTNASFTLRAFRSYFQKTTPIEIKAYEFIIDGADDPTGIKVINDVETTNGAIYNLAGQRINKTQKGVNIVNGKKVLF